MDLKNINLTRIGRWSFLGGIALALVSAIPAIFVAIPYLVIVLFVLGLAAGFLNIKEKDSTRFLVAIITLLLVGVASLEFSKLTPVITPILNGFIVFVSAVGLVVAVKQVLATTVQPHE